jgi:hypothetical protein
MLGTQLKEPDQQPVFFLRELFHGTIGGLLQDSVGDRALEASRLRFARARKT